MKQVVFAIALLAMASLTGCLNTEDSPVDENIDTTDDSTSDTTEDNTDTKDDELIEPVGVTGYTPPETANITVLFSNSTNFDWVAKDGNRITTSCLNSYSDWGVNFVVHDSDDRIIYLGNDSHDYGASHCGTFATGNGIKIDITLGPEPVKVGLTSGTDDIIDHYYWIVTF